MKLSDYCESVTIDPVANEFRSCFSAAVIDNNNFKAWRVLLFCQGSQTSIEWNPIIENSYDDAERQTCSGFVLTHRCIMLPRSGLTACSIAQATANHKLDRRRVAFSESRLLDSQPSPLPKSQVDSLHSGGVMYQCNQFCGGRLDTENFRLAAKERLLPFRCLHRH